MHSTPVGEELPRIVVQPSLPFRSLVPDRCRFSDSSGYAPRLLATPTGNLVLIAKLLLTERVECQDARVAVSYLW
jgi:hypothetical protein